MLQLDLKKEFKKLFNPPSTGPVLVEVPELQYLMLDGTGDPNNTAAYQPKVETLFSVAYTLKFMLKKAGALDYGVTSLEGLWWVEDYASFSLAERSNWLWTLLIMQPEQVTSTHLAEAAGEVERKKGFELARQIRLEKLNEGLAAQVMHLGPYSAEGPTVNRLHDFIKQNGYELTGKHHEIYLSDPRRVVPEKMKTVIRQPVKRPDPVS